MIRRYKRLIINSACFFLVFSQVIFIVIAQDQSIQKVAPGSQDKYVSTVESGSQVALTQEFKSYPQVALSSENKETLLLVANMDNRVYSEFYPRMSWYTYNLSNLKRKEAESYPIYYNSWYITKLSAKIYYLVDFTNTLIKKNSNNKSVKDDFANFKAEIAKLLDQNEPGIWNLGVLYAKVYNSYKPLTDYKLSQGKYSTSNEFTKKYNKGRDIVYDHKSRYIETRYDVYVRIMDKLDLFLDDLNQIKFDLDLK